MTEVPRFEKVLRRLDSDSDGFITPKEFKIGIRKLRIRYEKKWKLTMIQSLFQAVDSQKKTTLSISALSGFIRRDISPENSVKKGESESKSEGNKGSETKNWSDDDGDDDVFSRQKVVNDHALMKKVYMLHFLLLIGYDYIPY